MKVQIGSAPDSGVSGSRSSQTNSMERIPSGHGPFMPTAEPVKCMRRYHQRIPYLHLKSIDGEMLKKVEAERIPFAIAVGREMFCATSQGLVDFTAFRDVLREINYDGFAIVG